MFKSCGRNHLVKDRGKGRDITESRVEGTFVGSLRADPELAFLGRVR